MSSFLLAFIVSLAASLIALRAAGLGAHGLNDHDLDGPQKVHRTPVPRIGGASILLGLIAAASLGLAIGHPQAMDWALVVLCAAPAVAAGIAEDVTKRVRPMLRMAALLASGVMAMLLLDAVLTRTHLPGVDSVIGMAPVAVVLTLLVVCGVSNSVNIIDGFNGLASVCVLLMLAGLAYVGHLVGDPVVMSVAGITAAALLGFLVLNYPTGRIFLGDGGAYLLGFVVAVLGIRLSRNTAVSPLFPLLLCLYPVVETLFSMYRRRLLRGLPTVSPDGIHLHSLIHRRVVRGLVTGDDQRAVVARNAGTAPFLWMLCALSVVPAVVWWNNSQVLSGFMALFVVSYVALYWRIVRFRTPRWLMLGFGAPTEAAEAAKKRAAGEPLPISSGPVPWPDDAQPAIVARSSLIAAAPVAAASQAASQTAAQR